MDTMTDRELMEWLEGIPTSEETLAKLETMDIPDLEKDPEFVADTLKGMVTEDLLHAMAEQGLNRSQLAQKMGKSRQYIGRVLNESANFTLERLAEFACALDRKIEIRICHKDIPNWSRPGKDEEDVFEQASETILKEVPFPSHEGEKRPLKFAYSTNFQPERPTDLTQLEARRGKKDQLNAA